MSVSATSSEDRIEEDFVILTADTVVKDILQEMGTSKGTSPPPPAKQMPGQRGSNHRCGRHYSVQDSKPSGRQERSSLKSPESDLVVMDHDGRDLVEVYKTQPVQTEENNPHRRVSTSQSCHQFHHSSDGVDADVGELADCPRGFQKVKTASTRTDLFSGVVGGFVLNDREEKERELCLGEERTIHSSQSVTTEGKGTWTSDHKQAVDTLYMSRNSGSSQRRSRSTKAAFVDEVKDGSRSSEKSEMESSHNLDNKVVSEWHDTTEGPESGVMIEIHNMSDHHIKVFSNTGTTTEAVSTMSSSPHSAAETTPAPSAECGNVAEHKSDGDAGVTSALFDLVGGLDSQIRALCRNLESLVGFGTSPQNTAGTAVDTSPVDKSYKDEEDQAAGRSVDGKTPHEERYYDCLPPEQANKKKQDLPTPKSLQRRTFSAGTEDDCSRKLPTTNLQRQHDTAPESESHSAHNDYRQSSTVASGKQASQNLENHETAAEQVGIRRDKQETTAAGRLHSAGSDGTCGGLQTPQQRLPVLKTKVNTTRSLPVLMCRRNDAEDPANVIEISTESNGGLSESVLSRIMLAKTQGALSVCSEREGGKVNAVTMRELSQMFEQSDVLKAMWNNHKRQLNDVLASREKESARAGRLNQALLRARHMITSLRRQRQDLHHHMEKREEEFAATLRYHRNETAFLRRKLLTYLDEKKSAMTDPKCDRRLVAVLDTLLSLHLDREQFLALDMAKQTKINELKLLVVRQQLAMEELKEHNADLNHALNTLMQFLPDHGNSAHPNQPRAASSPYPRTTSTMSPTGGGRGCGGRGLGLSDVLHCERSMYMPHRSTSPELAAVTVFGVGGEHGPLTSPPEEVFDASRQRCHADGDHHQHHNIAVGSTSNSDTLAEDLLRELTLNGPGSPNFTLADVDR